MMKHLETFWELQYIDVWLLNKYSVSKRSYMNLKGSFRKLKKEFHYNKRQKVIYLFIKILQDLSLRCAFMFVRLMGYVCVAVRWVKPFWNVSTVLKQMVVVMYTVQTHSFTH